jgi:hypothetical protein
MIQQYQLNRQYGYLIYGQGWIKNDLESIEKESEYVKIKAFEAAM